MDRRKEEMGRLREEYLKKEEEQKHIYEKQLSKQMETRQIEFARYKQDSENKVKSLEIKLISVVELIDFDSIY